MKNMKNKLFVTLGILGMSLLSYAGTRHSLETSYPSYKGLIMAGYQGWFRGPQDGTGQGYGHYGTGKQSPHVCEELWESCFQCSKDTKMGANHNCHIISIILHQVVSNVPKILKWEQITTSFPVAPAFLSLFPMFQRY